MLCGGVLAGAVAANASVAVQGVENPYRGVIATRNLFGLEFPKAVDLVATNQPPLLRDIKLSGITTLPDATRAILRIMCAAQPPEPAKEISLFLTPGGRAEMGVQVLDIDVSRGLVKISNDGTLQTLDISKNAPKGNVALSPAGVTPVPPPPAGVSAVPTSGARRISSNEEQTWTMALRREQDLAKISAGQMPPDDMPPYPPNEVTSEADKEAMGGNNQGSQGGGP